MDMNERKKTKTKGISQWVPEFVYWNVRLMSQQWNQSQSSIIEEGVLSWMDKNRLKTPDWFKENPTELSLLLKELNGQTYFKDEKFVPGELYPILNNKSFIDVQPYDIAVLDALSKGLLLNEIASEFKSSGIIPNGCSSIEKRINKLRIYFGANNSVHLIAIAKDLGLI